MEILQNFYRQLLKSPLSLNERYAISRILHKAVRDKYVERWNAIEAVQSKYIKPLEALRKAGYLRISLANSTDLATSLRELSPVQNYLNYDKEFPGAIKYLSGIEELPEVKKVIADESLTNLASLYLGAPVQLYKVLAWWQFPVESPKTPINTQLWHRDRDDFSFLKLFLYCTDVDEKAGPHAFLPQTHQPAELLRLFEGEFADHPLVTGAQHKFLTDSELERLKYLGSKKVWLGPSGTCFLEDTRGFHRAYLPTESPRLIFSIVWTVGPGFDITPF